MKNVLLLSLFLVHPALGTEGVRVKVEILRTANGGIQPQAAIDADGTLHLIYFAGAAKGGNVFYVKRDADLSTWSDPIRVNSEKGSARRNGAISHSQLALGKDGRIHVTWFNMRPPKYFYSASRDDGQGFEPQRNLVTEHAEGVEAGASIAAGMCTSSGMLADSTKRTSEGSTSGIERTERPSAQRLESIMAAVFAPVAD